MAKYIEMEASEVASLMAEIGNRKPKKEQEQPKEEGNK